MLADIRAAPSTADSETRTVDSETRVATDSENMHGADSETRIRKLEWQIRKLGFGKLKERIRKLGFRD